MRRLAIALFAAAAMITTTPAMAAAPCKDAHGKFVKCPEKKAAPVAKSAAKAKPKATAKKAPKTATKSTGKCRDAKGRFAKCGTAGARPA